MAKRSEFEENEERIRKIAEGLRERERERPPRHNSTPPRPYRNIGLEERRRCEAITSAFPEQYCPECNIAYGLFMSAKRKVLRERGGYEPKGVPCANPNLLTSEEMARVRNMIPEHIEHLDNCKANQGGFDAED